MTTLPDQMPSSQPGRSKQGSTRPVFFALALIFCYAIAVTVGAFAKDRFVVRLPKDTQWATVYVALGSALVSLIAIIATTTVAVWSQKRSEETRIRDRMHTDARALREQTQRTLAPVLQFLTRADPSLFWNPFRYKHQSNEELEEDKEWMLDDNHDTLAGLNEGWSNCEPDILGMVISWPESDISTAARELADLCGQLLILQSHLIQASSNAQERAEAEAVAEEKRQKALSLVERIAALLRNEEAG